MYIKVKHILLALLILTILFLSFFVTRDLKKENKNQSINLGTKGKQKYNYYYANSGEGRFEICYLVAKKNGDWHNLPLTENFRKKYNEKDGILGNIQFDSIEYRPYASSNEDYYFKEDIYFVITQGKLKTSYRCYPIFENNGKGEFLDDVFLYDIKQLYNEYGKKIAISGVPITNLNSFAYLANGGDDEKSVAVTNRFHKKYPYFLDLFIHYSPLGANPITFIEEKSSWEKKEAYFEVDSIYECIKRHYIVSFLIDSNGFLDDAEVKLIGEYPYEKDSLVKASSQVFYKNSNWNYLKLSDNFKNKYNESKTVYNDINELNIDEITFGLFYNDDVNVMINKYKTIDGSNRWLYEKYIYDDNEYLDDVKILPIDYIGEDSEEAKEAYIKQYENNQ